MTPFLPAVRAALTGVARGAGRPLTRRVASATTLAVAASTIAVLAVQADGAPISEVDLNDGGVWITNTQGESAPMLGRLNKQIAELDLGVVAPGGSFDVFQTGTTVLVDVSPYDPLRGDEPDPDLRQLVPVDVVTGVLGDRIELTPTTHVEHGGRTVAFTETRGGATWVRSVDNLAGFSQDAVDPDIELGSGGRVAIQPDGRVVAMDVDDATVTPGEIGVDGTISWAAPTALGDAVTSTSDLTAVGGRAVALDAATAELTVGDGAATTIPGTTSPATPGDPATVVLQRPTSGGDTVHVATTTGLLAVQGGGDPQPLDVGTVDGAPAAPVVNGGCLHAAWADPAADSYVRICDGETTAMPIPDLEAGARLVFRTNRGVTVLNDVTTGTGWIEQAGSLKKIDNWTEIDPRLQDDTQRRERIDQTERTEENHPPDPRDDDLGARAGQDTVLPVTANDRDPDGDVLTIGAIEVVDGVTPESTQVVGGGTQLQVAFPDAAAGQTTRLRYTVGDGRDGEGTATVTLRVKGPEEQTAPVELDPDVDLAATVVRGASVSTYVLPAFVDPEGDDLILDDAEIDESQGQVDFRSDGTITFHDSGSGTGVKNIGLTVSDGRASFRSTLPVTVVADRAPPTLVADHVTAVAGQETVVEPLLNDASPDGTPLALSSVDRTTGLQIGKRPDGTSFTVTAGGVDTYYLPYAAINDSGTAESFVRVDVISDPTENRPPTAVKDQAVLSSGGSVLVDILSNDLDPDGDVLVVQEVRAPEGIKASLIGRRMIRVEASREVVGVEQVTYVVSDGRAVSEGTVGVIARDGARRNRAPQAVDDVVRLRAGAVGSIPVLANDGDPDGDPLTLLQSDLQPPDDSSVVFVSGRQLRMRAPTTPGDLTFTYGVRDPGGRRAAAAVRVKVLPDTAEDNSPPDPDPIEDRVISEQRTRIQLRAAGSDPDGDAVSLKGIARAPRLGRIVQTGLDWFSYESFTDSYGTDTFQVTVADKYGAEALVDVRIGVAPRALTNQPPVAFDDALVVQPGRTVEYDVRGNDVDADGDALSLSEDLQTPEGVEAGVRDGLVSVPTPALEDGRAARSSVGYTVDDGLGGTDSAFLTVTADPAAPLYSPVTRDDAADLAEIAGKKPGDTVVVDVLRNDGDLDGARADLVLSTLDPQVSRVVEGGLEVTLAAQDQVLAYRVVDADEMFSFGFVYVAGTDTVPPVLNPGSALPVEVVSGEPVEIALSDYVLVRAGRSPRLTTQTEVEARKSDSSTLVQDFGTLTFTSEPGYAGAASVTAEVTDGNGADGLHLDDPTRLTSRLTIPIEVLPSGNLPPTMRSGAVTVDGAGEETTSVDLANFAEDPNLDDLAGLEFDVTGGDGVVQVEQDGSRLQLTGIDQGVAPETTVPLAVTVTDPAGASAQGTLAVTVLPTTRPTVQVGAIEVDARQGEVVTVDVADYATNPFPESDLVLRGAAVESSDGPAPAVTAEGTVVTIRPPESMSGTATVRFQLNDQLDAPERAVTGRIRVSVTGVPEAPSRPSVSAVASGTATLTWNEPIDNGAPITSYEVEGSNGFSRTCTLTSCVLDGLDNGTPYTFTVVAVNEVGSSKPSPASAEAVPDEVPGTPVGLTVAPTKKDGELLVSWGETPNEGSELTGFSLQLRGGPAPRAVDAGARSLVWAGLSNTTQYSFTILARNEAGPGDPSAASDAVNPYGPPVPAAAAPVGRTQDDGNLGGSVSVTWDPADDNGNPVSGYELEVLENGASVQTIPVAASERSRTLSARNGVAYSFRLRAQNAAGFGATGPTSTPVTPYGKASAPRDAKAVDQDQQAQVSWSAPAELRGTTIDHYEVTGPQGTRSTSGTSLVYGFGANAGPYAVTIVPVTLAPDGRTEVTGDSVKVEGIRPYGKPNASQPSATADGQQVVLSWTGVSPNGRPVEGLDIQVDDGGWERVTSSGGSRRVGDDYEQAHSIQVRTTDSEGQTTLSEKKTARSADKPARTVSNFRFGAEQFNTDYCRTSTCRQMFVDLSGFPRGTYTLYYSTDCKKPDGSVNATCLDGGAGATRYTSEQVTVTTPYAPFTHAGRAFGYVGATVWVDVDGQESNRVRK